MGKIKTELEISRFDTSDSDRLRVPGIRPERGERPAMVHRRGSPEPGTKLKEQGIHSEITGRSSISQHLQETQVQGIRREPGLCHVASASDLVGEGLLRGARDHSFPVEAGPRAGSRTFIAMPKPNMYQSPTPRS